MIHSMTGFGRCEISKDSRKITVEVKSVNHRYLDMNIRMPKKLYRFEPSIRNWVKEVLERGKIDISISYEDTGEGSLCLQYNESFAREYFQILQHISQEFDIENDVKATYIAKCPEVVTMQEQVLDDTELDDLVQEAIRGALQALIAVREREGEALQQNLLSKAEHMKGIVHYLEEHSPQILSEYRKKLEEKVRELLENASIDEGRIAAEVTLYADKICIDEEIVRLQSHISSLVDNLQTGDRIGRKLDFIAQEMNREANTILSKTSDLDLINQGIELKNLIEEIREQVQNIE